MSVLDYVNDEWLVFLTHTSKNCGAIQSTAHARHEDISRVIVEGMNRARSPPQFGPNDSSVVRCFLGTRGDNENSIGVGSS